LDADEVNHLGITRLLCKAAVACGQFREILIPQSLVWMAQDSLAAVTIFKKDLEGVGG
jgi:hypothetical protein